MRSRLFCCLTAFSLSAFASEVWDGVKPFSDAVFYLDSRQAGKAMEKRLWEKIDEDRKKAQKEEREEEERDKDGPGGGDFLSDLGKLDPELLVNVTLVSRDPLRLMAEGSVQFHAGKEDAAEKTLDGFFALFSEDGATAKKSGAKSGERTATLPGAEGKGGLAFTVKPSGGGAKGHYEFLALYNLKKKIELPPPKPSPVRAHIAETFRASKPAACLVLNSIRWAPLVGGGASSRNLRRLMVRAEGIGIAVSVHGTSMRLTLRAAFRKPEVAEAYARKAGALVRDFTRVVSGPILRNLRSDTEGVTVRLSAEIDIGASWATLMNLQSSDSGTDIQSVGSSKIDDKEDDE